MEEIARTNAEDLGASSGLSSTSLIDLRPDSPHRPLDWRWERARHLRAGLLGRRRRHDDHWVLRIVRFQADRERDTGGGDRSAGADPDLLGALRLFGGVGARRLEVEARLLAGQSSPEIAGRCGLDPAVVEAYEAAFHAVRDRLGAADWLLFTAVGPRLHDGTGLDEGSIWKLLALRGGPIVLEAAIDHARNRMKSAEDPFEPGRAAFFSDPVDRLIAASRLPAGPADARRWLRIDARLRDLEARIGTEAASARAGAVVSPSIDAAIAALEASEMRARGTTDARLRPSTVPFGGLASAISPALEFPDLSRLARTG